MRRYLETFFHRSWLYLVPLVIVLVGSAAPAYRAVRDATPYTAQATIAVNLDPTRQSPYGQRPPAQLHAELLGELMATDSFILAVLEQTGLEQGMARYTTDARLAGAVRSRWKQAAVGANTMEAFYRCREPDFCVRFVAAVLEKFGDQVAAARLARKTAAAEFYQQQLRIAEQRLLDFPRTDPGRDAVRATYEMMLTRLVDAGLQEMLESRDREEGFKIIAPPQIPADPVSPLVAAALPLGLGAVLGLTLAAGLIALVTWTDRSVRSPEEVLRRLGVQTVAVVPAGWRSGLSLGDAGPRSPDEGSGYDDTQPAPRPGPAAVSPISSHGDKVHG